MTGLLAGRLPVKWVFASLRAPADARMFRIDVRYSPDTGPDADLTGDRLEFLHNVWEEIVITN